MKVLTPPQINSLDELLDVVLHPDKLVKYLTQMAEMRNAIIAQLDIYTTKDKADQYLVQATQKVQDALALEAKAKALLTTGDAALVTAKAAMAEAQTAWERKKGEEHTVLVARDVALNERARKQLLAAETVAAQAEANAQKTEELTRLQARLDRDIEKMEQRKALLSAIA